MSELKDCPFCGGGAWVVKVPDTRRFRPQCKKCGADLGEFDRQADAVTAWNHRALSRSEVPAGMVEFVRDVAAQKPERPDYWNSCGQCERNSDRAQELLDSTTPPAQGEQAEVRREDQ